MSGRSGLPCRGDVECLAVFGRARMGSDERAFRHAIADRDAHEWNRHQYVHDQDEAPASRPRRPSVGSHHGGSAQPVGVARARELGQRSGEARRARALARTA